MPKHDEQERKIREEKRAQLRIGEDALNMRTYEGTYGRRSVDISGLYGRTGLRFYDPGLADVAICRSAISYVDGEAGILLYRGYPIEELAEKTTFVETAYLLINGHLTKAEEGDAF